MALDLASISIEGRVSDTKFTRLSLQSNEDGGLVLINSGTHVKMCTPKGYG
jgi:hypothetical protein